MVDLLRRFRAYTPLPFPETLDRHCRRRCIIAGGLAAAPLERDRHQAHVRRTGALSTGTRWPSWTNLYGAEVPLNADRRRIQVRAAVGQGERPENHAARRNS